MNKLATKPTGYRVLSLEQETPAQSKETDAEIIERLRERFEILDDMTRAVKKGAVRAMIVSGAPGVGKSFGVEKVLGKHGLMADIAQDEKLKKYEIVKGAMSAIGLYSKLYEFRRSVPFRGTLTVACYVVRVCPTVSSSRVVLSLLPTSTSRTSRARSCKTIWQHWRAVAITLT